MNDRAEQLADDLRASHCHALAKRSVAALSAAVNQGCWIYGAGNYGRLIARLLKQQAIVARGFIDRKAAEPGLPNLLSLSVIAPGAFGSADAAGCALIVGTHSYGVDQQEIVSWGRQLGFTEIIVPAELPDLLGSEAASYWLTARARVVDHADEVSRLAVLLADSKSVDVLMGLARFRATGDAAAHPRVDRTGQYFPHDVPLALDRLSLMDGGALDGDTAVAALAAGAALVEWHAFEPDPHSFAALVRTAARLRAPRTVLHPNGLAAACETLRFTDGNGGASRYDEAGERATQVVALDAILPGYAPTYIKLDIEGFERQALSGMSEIVRNARPQLAVSIYHNPDDLWELPLLVHDLLPEARLFIRQHGFGGFDTVLYALP